MKCLYFLSPNLDISQKVSDDLHEIGLLDWYLHVISKDEAGLNQKHIHSSNYLETLDLFHGSTVGGFIGFLVACVAVALTAYYDPFGFPLSNGIYLLMFIFFTLFGIWEGGLYGIDSENQKIAPFHDEIESGKFLVLVYAAKEQEQDIITMMKKKHPESKLVGVDKHVVNPFSKTKMV
ncbi:MAG: hypothetical protein KUG78_20045 [Kangiellaceae bacterium]|nr:hypothetical protein [Kangiellaceae bacterium]